LREAAKSGLSDWLATYIDCAIFSILTGVLLKDIKWTPATFPFGTIEAPSPDRLIIAGGKTAENLIQPVDVFSTEMISKAKMKAKADPDNMIRPIIINGKETYVMVIDQYQARDLKHDTAWLEAQQQGNVRGEKNPIFTGALGMWDGVVIHEHNRIPRTETGANDTKVSHALFLGAQAAVFAEGEPAEMVEKTFDYENKYGVSFGRMFGLKKSRFKFDGVNETDFGVINVLTSSVDDND
jgi:N4-gp56 family major capsid protein